MAFKVIGKTKGPYLAATIRSIFVRAWWPAMAEVRYKDTSRLSGVNQWMEWKKQRNIMGSMELLSVNWVSKGEWRTRSCMNLWRWQSLTRIHGIFKAYLILMLLSAIFSSIEWSSQDPAMVQLIFWRYLHACFSSCARTSMWSRRRMAFL